MRSRDNSCYRMSHAQQRDEIQKGKELVRHITETLLNVTSEESMFSLSLEEYTEELDRIENECTEQMSRFFKTRVKQHTSTSQQIPNQDLPKIPGDVPSRSQIVKEAICLTTCNNQEEDTVVRATSTSSKRTIKTHQNEVVKSDQNSSKPISQTRMERTPEAKRRIRARNSAKEQARKAAEEEEKLRQLAAAEERAKKEAKLAMEQEKKERERRKKVEEEERKKSEKEEKERKRMEELKQRKQMKQEREKKLLEKKMLENDNGRNNRSIRERKASEAKALELEHDSKPSVAELSSKRRELQDEKEVLTESKQKYNKSDQHRVDVKKNTRKAMFPAINSSNSVMNNEPKESRTDKNIRSISPENTDYEEDFDDEDVDELLADFDDVDFGGNPNALKQ